MSLKKAIRMTFCKHEYQKIAFKQEEDANVRYSIRLYRCSKCGKEIWVDGRNDYINQ